MWISEFGQAQLDESGRALRLVGICFDCTERKNTEELARQLNRELEDRLEELETVLDVLPVGVAIATDPECRHISGNRALCF